MIPDPFAGQVLLALATFALVVTWLAKVIP